MKRKVSNFMLALLACLLILASCANPDMQDQTGNVRFLDGANLTKSLNRVEPSFDAEELYWMYEAEKVSALELNTGVTNAKTFVSAASETTANKGLSQYVVGPFSLGNWNFKLYGYSDNTCKTLVYSGEAPATIRKGVTNSIRVAVSGKQSVGGKGYLNFPAATQVEDKDGNLIDVSSLTEVITYTKDVAGSKTVTAEFVDGNRTLQLEVGGYLVTVSYVDPVSKEECATSSVYVNIYDNLTSSYVGTVDENTEDASFDASAVKTDVVVQTADKAKKTVFEVAATPESIATSNKTVLSVPEGKLDGDVKATVTTYSAPAANKKFDVVVNDAPLAALDITITDSVGEVKDFKDHPITITTYIASGLGDKNNIKVKHDNGKTVEEIVPESYNNTTGELTFKVTHLSEYYVVSNAEAFNVTKNLAYSSFQEAVEKASDKDIVVLLKDVAFVSPTQELNNIHIGGSYENAINLTLDMNGHKIAMDKWSVFTVYDGDVLTVKGNGEIDAHGRIFDVKPHPKAAKGTPGGTLFIKDGSYTTTNSGVPGYSPMIFFGNDSYITIDGGSFTCLNTESPYNMPIIQANGNQLDYKELTINGGIYNGDLLYMPSNSIVTINDGEFNSNIGSIYQKCGVLNVNGGSFSTSANNKWAHYGGAYSNCGSTIVVEACHYPSGNPVVNISDKAVFAPFASNDSGHVNYPVLIIDWRETEAHSYDHAVTTDIEIPYQYAYITGLVGDPATHDFNNSNTSTVNPVIGTPVARYISPGHDAVYCNSLNDAILNCPENGVVELLKDSKVDSKISIDNNIYLNLANHTLSSSISDCMFEIGVGGDLIVDNGTIIETGKRPGEIFKVLGGKLTINGGTFETAKGVMAVVTVWDNGIFIVNNGSLKGSLSDYCIASNGSKGQKANIVINNGLIEGKCYFPAAGVYTINGGKFQKATTNIYQKGGVLTITDGDFTAVRPRISAGKWDDGQWAHAEGQMLGTGDPVIIEACGYPAGEPIGIITGGTYHPFDEEGTCVEGSAANCGIHVIHWANDPAKDPRHEADMSKTTVKYGVSLGYGDKKLQRFEKKDITFYNVK